MQRVAQTADYSVVWLESQRAVLSAVSKVAHWADWSAAHLAVSWATLLADCLVGMKADSSAVWWVAWRVVSSVALSVVLRAAHWVDGSAAHLAVWWATL